MQRATLRDTILDLLPWADDSDARFPTAHDIAAAIYTGGVYEESPYPRFAHLFE
jgi:hypothetical protein